MENVEVGYRVIGVGGQYVGQRDSLIEDVIVWCSHSHQSRSVSGFPMMMRAVIID